MAFQRSSIFHAFIKIMPFDVKEERLRPYCVCAVPVVGNCPEFYFQYLKLGSGHSMEAVDKHCCYRVFKIPP